MRIHRILYLSFLLFATGNLSARQPEKFEKVRIDSIFAAIDKMPADTVTVEYVVGITREFLWEFDLPETYNALKYALKISKELNYDLGEFRCYSEMGNYCVRVGSNDFSLINRKKALEVATRMNDSSRIIGSYVGLGLAYHGMKKDSMALEYYLKAKASTEASGESDRISRLYSFLGWSYQAMHKDSMALTYALKALELRRAANYDLGILASLGSVRSIYSSLGDLRKAREANDEVVKQLWLKHDSVRIAECYLYNGEDAMRMHKNDSALYFFRTALQFASAKDDKAVMADSYHELSILYDTLGNRSAAYDNFKMYTVLEDSITLADRIVHDQRSIEIYDLESKNAEIDLLNKESEIKQKDIDAQQKKVWGLAIILLFTLVLAVLVYRGYRQKKKSAELISLQKKIVEEKQREMTDSIKYARRIQQSLMPSDSVISRNLGRLKDN